MARTRQPTYDNHRTEAPPESAVRLPSQDLWGNAALLGQLGGDQAAASGEAAKSSRTDITHLTPDYVAAHREELGIPDEAPVEDFFYEFLAKRLATQNMSEMDPDAQGISAEDRDRRLAFQELLTSWGYQSTVSEDQEIIDPETGLYAVRFDPLEGEAGQGRNSVVAFRGTEAVRGDEFDLDNPFSAFNDVVADLGPSVGSSQYDPNKEAIAALIGGGTEDAVLTGHSLGGYLAQRAASDNADAVRELVTFQAGGIDEADAHRFEAANADGHADVRHHQTNWDLVHRAGEDRIDGTFFEHRPNNPTQGHSKYLMYSDDETEDLADAGGKTVSTTDHDPVSAAERHAVEAARTGVGGLGRIALSPLRGAWELGEGLVETGQDAWGRASAGFGDLLGGDVWGGLSGLAGAGGSLITGTGGALLDGLGTMGSNLLTGGGQLLSAGENLVEAGWEGAKDLGGKALSGLASAGSGLVDALTGW